MSEVDLLPIIKRLPAQLANQIAAGEVIERPASVVKELIENALDAQASRIDVELINGGMESIVVSDDGHGIQTNELALAISRHATSKIDSVEDLLNLHSLGFRGEALASICSVSQWEMISRPNSQKQAAKISYLMSEQVVDINHAPGTRMSVKQLFCNTPARRKFLRAERTEYRHCDEVIKRMALARFDVAFYVKHNGRQTLKLPVVSEDIGRSRRVAQICGESFIKQSLVIDYPHSGMRLWGWISQAEYSRQSTDLQYFYINGRIIRDRVINHAIRLAYQHVLPPGRHAAYVLHLDIDPAAVDVNVHPTKHEVRFRESRIIHDFISRSIRDAIHLVSPNLLPQDSIPHTEYNVLQSSYETDAALVNRNESVLKIAEQHGLYQQIDSNLFGNVLTIINGRFALTQQQQKLFLIDLQAAAAIWISQLWRTAFDNNEIKSLPLLIPLRLAFSEQEIENFEKRKEQLTSLGFELSVLEDDNLLIRKIPSLIQSYKIESLVTQFLSSNVEPITTDTTLHGILFDLIPDYTKLDLTIMFAAIESDNLHLSKDFSACWRELTTSDLTNLLGK